MRNVLLRRCVGLVLAAVGSWAVPARADVVSSVDVPAGGGLPALSVGFGAQGELLAATCSNGGCSLNGAILLSLPDEVKAQFRSAKLAVVPIGADRRVVWVSVPMHDAERAWEAIITAQPGTSIPRAVFADWTGWTTGEFGLRRGAMLQISPVDARGARRVVVGEQREDVTLCGRPTVLAPQLLTASDLEFHPAKVQRLSPTERAAAHAVIAERIVEPDGDAPQGNAGVDEVAGIPPEPTRFQAPVLVRATVASSAVGMPGALTDGDPSTSWAENRGGAGRGEFVVMTASSSLPLHAFEITIRPTGEVTPQGAAPKQFWLASEGEVWLVTMPEDAWLYPGARYRIPLGGAVQLGCVALVTESVWKEKADTQVTFAELVAVSEFDLASIPGLVGALAGGGERAIAAAAVLSASGEAAHRAVAERFETLDERGRRAALDVLDSADCAVSSPAYVDALLGAYRAQRMHAKDRLHRCGERAAPALEAALGNVSSPRDPLLLAELALAAPERAVRKILQRLPGERGRRRLLRDALSLAARDGDGLRAVEALLAENPPTDVALDVMRSMGPALGDMRQVADKQLERISKGEAFQTRYLILEPAGELARRGSAAAKALIARSLAHDESPYVRTRAAQLVGNATDYQSELLGALRDTNVRVREAALQALAASNATFAESVILERLRDDPWPLVRKAAADSLAVFPPDSRLDERIAAAAHDPSPSVQAAAISSLGVRRARNYAPEVLELFSDSAVAPTVRIAAAKSLGRFCFEGAADALTEATKKLLDPMAEQDDRELGWASLGALGRIAPSNLKERLLPLLSPSAPTRIRQVAGRLLGRAGACHLTNSVHEQK